MPFVTVQVSRNLNSDTLVDDLLEPINALVTKSLNLSDVPVKSLIVPIDNYLLSGSIDFQGFAYIIIECFPGRSTQLKRSLVEDLLGVLKKVMISSGLTLSLSARLCEIEPTSTKVFPDILGRNILEREIVASEDSGLNHDPAQAHRAKGLLTKDEEASIEYRCSVN